MPTYIIFDLEFMVVRKQQHMADIIEIGAVKMTEHEGTPVNRFHSYVKPSRQYKLTPETTPFTGITQEQVNQAPTFPDMLDAFLEWIGEDTYYLCAWGPDDKYPLIQHCRYHHLPLVWLQNYNDIQLVFTRLHHSDHRQRFGLKRALEHLQLPFDGIHTMQRMMLGIRPKFMHPFTPRLNWPQITPPRRYYTFQRRYTPRDIMRIIRSAGWLKCWEWRSRAVP